MSHLSGPETNDSLEFKASAVPFTLGYSGAIARESTTAKRTRWEQDDTGSGAGAGATGAGGRGQEQEQVQLGKEQEEERQKQKQHQAQEDQVHEEEGRKG